MRTTPGTFANVAIKVFKAFKGSAAIELRPVRPAGWWYDALPLLGFVALTFALDNGYLLAADVAVRDWADGHRPDAAYWTARVLNYLGQGGQVLAPLSALLAGLLGWRLRSPRPILPVVAVFLLTSATVGPLKYWLDRGYPRRDCAEEPVCAVARPEELFSDPAQGAAYPSGHTANTIVWFGLIVVLLSAVLRAYGYRPLRPAQRWLLRLLPPLIVFCSTVYLGFHWVTDSIAGVLIGLVLDRLMARAPWPTWCWPGLDEPPPASRAVAG